MASQNARSTETSELLILFFAFTDFDRNPQREQYVAAGLAKNRPVIYLEAPFSLMVLRERGWQIINKIAKWRQGLRPSPQTSGDNILFWTPPPSLFPFDKLRWVNSLYYRFLAWELRRLVESRFPKSADPVLYITQPRTGAVIKHLRNTAVIVDWCNPWVEHAAHLIVRRRMLQGAVQWYYRRKRAAALDLLRQATAIITVAGIYRQQCKDWGFTSTFIRSGVPTKAWLRACAEPGPPPPDLPQGRPLVGVVAARLYTPFFEMEVMKEVVRRRPDWSWAFIGLAEPAFEAILAGLPNVHMLGYKASTSLPSYVSRFDVCLVPYKKNTLTQSGLPAKLVEYLAAGKPIVTYPADDICAYQRLASLVYFAQTADEYIRAIETALAESGTKREERLRLAADLDWDNVVPNFQSAIDDCLRRVTHAPSAHPEALAQ